MDILLNFIFTVQHSGYTVFMKNEMVGFSFLYLRLNRSTDLYVSTMNSQQIYPTTSRSLERWRPTMGAGGDAAAWMLENQLEDRLRRIADEEIKRQVRN